MSMDFRYGEMYIPQVGGLGPSIRYRNIYMDLWGKTFRVAVKKVYVDADGQPVKPECDANAYMAEEYPHMAEQLDRNGGVYYSSQGIYENPFALLEMVRENRLTLHKPRLEIHGGSKDYAPCYSFHGNICEVSYAFYFRIFSPAFAARVREKALDRPIYPHDDYKLLVPVLNACPSCGGTNCQVRGATGMACWAVICKCGYKGPIRENDDNAAFAWNDGLKE